MALMCMAYEGAPTHYVASLELGATVITWTFIFEMGIKLIGLGCSQYWSDGWNQLDGSIVIMSIVEMVLTAIMAGNGMNLSFLRILRMLRVLRMLRLMRSWKGLYKIVTTFGKAIPQMSNLFVLMFLVAVIFSLLGMQIFGGQYNPDTGYSKERCGNGWGDCPDPSLKPLPKYNFDYFGPSLSAVFILMTGEWIDAMEPAISVLGGWSVVYFVTVVLIGRYLLINLLVAILLDAFGDDSDRDRDKDASDTPPSTNRSGLNSNRSDDAPNEFMLAPSEVKWPRDYSLMLFHPNSAVRNFTRRLIARPEFDQIIILAIVFSSICLALDSPRLDPTSDLAFWLRHLDLFWTGLFFFELCTKVITFQFCCAKDAYIKNPWNQLDLCIVCVSFLVLLAETFPVLRPLKTLRILRVLRPLRLVSRNPGMRLIVTSLAKAAPAVSNVFGVVLALQLVFAILGMQLFMGELATCSNPAILTRAECHEARGQQLAAAGGAGRHLAAQYARRRLKGGGDATWEEGDPVLWQNSPKGSFDDFGSAMRLLYIMSSGDEWETPMYSMQAAVGEGMAPIRNDFSPAAFFAVLWMFVGSFFALNLFVGVIVDNFNRIKKESEASATQTPAQQQWIKTMAQMVVMRPMRVPRAPSNCLRRAMFHVITSQLFDGFITFVIIVNVGVMGCDYWGIEHDAEAFQLYTTAMLYFSYVYYVECVLKLAGLGPAGYFGDAWCQFDFFLVCTSLVDQFATELLAAVLPLPPMLLRVLRVFRILRILRLLKGAKELRNLIVTMILSFPSLLNVGSMLCLVTFIYAVLGVNLFTFVAHQDNLNDQRNFDTLGSAFLTLFQCLTGDNWSGMMTDAMVDETSALCSKADGNCGSQIAIPYFVSFQVLGSFVFLNLVVAVILENFSALGAVISAFPAASDLDTFNEVWAEFDPDGDGYIESKSLIPLVSRLPAPLGLKGVDGARAKDIIKLCFQLELNQRWGHLAYRDVQQALVRTSYFARHPDKMEEHRISEEAFNDLTPESATRYLQSEAPPLPEHVTSVERLREMSDAQFYIYEQVEMQTAVALHVMSKHMKGLQRWRNRAKASGIRGRMNPKAAAALRPGIPAFKTKRNAARNPREQADQQRRKQHQLKQQQQQQQQHETSATSATSAAAAPPGTPPRAGGGGGGRQPHGARHLPLEAVGRARPSSNGDGGSQHGGTGCHSPVREQASSKRAGSSPLSSGNQRRGHRVRPEQVVPLSPGGADGGGGGGSGAPAAASSNRGSALLSSRRLLAAGLGSPKWLPSPAKWRPSSPSVSTPERLPPEAA